MWTLARSVPLGSIVLLITCHRLASSQPCDPLAPYSCDLSVSFACNAHWMKNNFYSVNENCYAGSCFEAQALQSTMTSALACKTMNTHCLSFYHRFIFVTNVRLTVFLNITSVDTEGNTLAFYDTINATNNTTWTLHQIKITSKFDFKVVFTYITPKWGVKFLIDEIKYARFECSTITTTQAYQITSGAPTHLQNDQRKVSSRTVAGIVAAVVIAVLFIVQLFIFSFLHCRDKFPFRKKLFHKNDNLNCPNPTDERSISSGVNRNQPTEDTLYAKPSEGDGYEIPETAAHVKGPGINGPAELQKPEDGDHSAAGDNAGPVWATAPDASPSWPSPAPLARYANTPQCPWVGTAAPPLKEEVTSAYQNTEDHMYSGLEPNRAGSLSHVYHALYTPNRENASLEE